jgi:pimeloyl-ACP methyl ester carboxylesterase
MGAEDHMFLPGISKLVKDHSSSELFVIPDCGHVVNVEKADVFNEKVIGFIKALRQKRGSQI